MQPPIDLFDGSDNGRFWDPKQPISTGIPTLDALLDGGYRRGGVDALMGNARKELAARIAVNAAFSYPTAFLGFGIQRPDGTPGLLSCGDRFLIDSKCNFITTGVRRYGWRLIVLNPGVDVFDIRHLRNAAQRHDVVVLLLSPMCESAEQRLQLGIDDLCGPDLIGDTVQTCMAARLSTRSSIIVQLVKNKWGPPRPDPIELDSSVAASS